MIKCGKNPIGPSVLSAQERLAEVAEILAMGLIRLRSRQSSRLSGAGGECLLDCAGHQSGHANALTDDGALE